MTINEFKEAVKCGARTLRDLKAYQNIKKEFELFDAERKKQGVLFDDEKNCIHTKDMSLVDIEAYLKLGYCFIPF